MAKKTVMQQEPIEDNEQLSESYISIGLGLLVVVVVGILLYNYFTQKNQNQDTSSDSTIDQEATISAQPGKTYSVVEGDTLWSISEKAYGTGYNWSQIAQANNLSNTDDLVAGQELKIPEISPQPSALAQASVSASSSPMVSPTPVVSPSPVAQTSVVTTATPTPATPTTSEATISGTSYTIVAGDTLWNIACRAYNDCYQWTKIAQENKLDNPNLIHVNNTLTLSR